MPASKIQSEQEVIRWLEEGKTYQWMADEYMRRYNLEVTPTMFSNFRARRGLSRRFTRNDDLIPWEVKREHRWSFALAMLRVEARRRSGREIREVDAKRLASWKRSLEEQDAVVHYEPDTEEGWFYVPRRKGIDLDLIREPERKTTRRSSMDY